jgi:iron complex transport system substrate-binding protein
VIAFSGAAKILRRRGSLKSGLTAAVLAAAALLGPVAWAAALAAETQFAAQSPPPRRVVSINLCADQLAVQLLQPERIAALSSLARDRNLSYVADAARSFPLVGESAEEVLAQKPDLVLAGSIGAKPTVELLRRFGVEVYELGLAGNFDEIRAQIRDLGWRLGVDDRAQSVIASMDQQLKSSKETAGRKPTDWATGNASSAAFLLPNGYSAGGETLNDAILHAAGFSNHAATLGLRGYGVLPLELIVSSPPDLLVIDAGAEAPSQASRLLEHPALESRLPATSRVALASRFTICAGPQTAEAVALLAARR